jgi:Repeat of Unknown Function (DUF347)
VNDRALLRGLTRRGALRVPEITVYFWVIKALSTALGESTSDYSVHAIDPVIAVCLGFIGFVVALSLQFWVRRYIAWTYWLAVVGVGVFGTMAADVLHVRFGVPYAVSSVLYGLVLAAVFVSWQKTEKTLSFHTIDTPRRDCAEHPDLLPGRLPGDHPPGRAERRARTARCRRSVPASRDHARERRLTLTRPARFELATSRSGGGYRRKRKRGRNGSRKPDSPPSRDS